MPIEKIADFDREAQEWKVVPASGDPSEVEVESDGAGAGSADRAGKDGARADS
jgi:hypothetical protein